MQRTGNKSANRRSLRQKARPMNPVQLTREILGGKEGTAFVRDMRDKYEIELGQLDVPEGLADDVREYLGQFYDGAEALSDFKGSTDDDREYIVKSVQENLEAMVDVFLGLILQGKYEPVPREMLDCLIQLNQHFEQRAHFVQWPRIGAITERPGGVGMSFHKNSRYA